MAHMCILLVFWGFYYFFTFFLMEFASLAKGIALIGLIGPGIGIGLIGLGAMNAIGRNPNAVNTIKTNMLIAMAFAEFLGLLAFLGLFLIK